MQNRNRRDYLTAGSLVFVYVVIISACSWAEVKNLRNMRSAEEREFLYSIVMWIMGAIALSLNCLAVYLIVRKSTIDLSGYKLYLLNFTITDMFLGCVLSFCFQPIAIVPGGGVQVVGLLKGFGGIGGHIQYTVVAFIFGHSVVGLNYCFIYRYASLCDVGARRLLRQRWFRFALIGSGELICFSLAILIFDMRVPDQYFKDRTLERFPFQLSFFENTTFFGYDLSISPNASIVVSSILLLTPASCAVNFICAALIVQRLHKYKEQLTRRTYHLHLKLLIALILQTTIPLFLFVLPITCIYVTTLYDLSGPLTNTLTRYIPMIALALHPIINPCITISFIEPYRRAVLPQCFSEQRIHPETTTTSYC